METVHPVHISYKKGTPQDIGSKETVHPVHIHIKKVLRRTYRVYGNGTPSTYYRHRVHGNGTSSTYFILKGPWKGTPPQDIGSKEIGFRRTYRVYGNGTSSTMSYSYEQGTPPGHRVHGNGTPSTYYPEDMQTYIRSPGKDMRLISTGRRLLAAGCFHGNL